ncbi:MAG: hypothetical protein PHF67_05005 [Candidatus Nanoarchaeia archaeon]|nr:hypothetical protein [Candidatus Nanoarchaeia archaeon]
MLQYITETAARALIESEVRANTVKNSTDFANHLIDTGRIAYDVARQIMEKHPSLAPQINPDWLRVEGYFHDFGKIKEGGNYHEVSTAHTLLTSGEEMGLVTGGSHAERIQALKGIALIVPPDFALFEALGEYDYPEGAVYPDDIGKFKDRVEQLRRDLSYNGNPLTIEEFALPFKLDQQIGLYADLTNVNGKRVSVSERVAEIAERYGSPGKFYDPLYAGLVKRIRPRIMVVGNTIEALLQ